MAQRAGEQLLVRRRELAFRARDPRGGQLRGGDGVGRERALMEDEYVEFTKDMETVDTIPAHEVAGGVPS